MPVRVDITGQRFGRLTVRKPTKKYRRKYYIFWECLCDCGKTVFVTSNDLQTGNTKACGCLVGKAHTKNLTGQRFGRLVALNPTSRRSCDGSIVWKLRCDCGRIVFTNVNSLNSGHTKSCGCLKYAVQFVKYTNINPKDIPFEIINLMKARGKLKKAIKQAS